MTGLGEQFGVPVFQKGNGNAPQVWGKRSAEFFGALEGQEVLVALVSGQRLRGLLIGMDVYDLVIRQSSGLGVSIHKGALLYVHAASTKAPG